MAGFKAIVLWFPAERLALANGWFVMLGALGAVTATAPAELVVADVGWRGLFAVLGALSALAALLIVGMRARRRSAPCRRTRRRNPSACLTIYRDRRFWRLAPLSAIGIGTSWSLQGLWAAPWLRDVDGLDRAGRGADLERDGGRRQRQRALARAGGHRMCAASASRPSTSCLPRSACRMAAQLALIAAASRGRRASPGARLRPPAPRPC